MICAIMSLFGWDRPIKCNDKIISWDINHFRWPLYLTKNVGKTVKLGSQQTLVVEKVNLLSNFGFPRAAAADQPGAVFQMLFPFAMKVLLRLNEKKMFG